jgi:hypothetical protein
MASRAAKRADDAAELPLAERARRAMTALVADLGEVVSLFDAAAAGQTGPLPVAETLADSAFGLLDRAALVVRRDQVAVIKQQWLPPELLQYIFEFLIGCRKMSRFGANAPRLRLTGRSAEAADQLRCVRLVCRQWARAAGNAVVTITPPSRGRLFVPGKVVEAFPNASILNLDSIKPDKTSKKYWALCSQLAQLYSRRSNRPFYVRLIRDALPHMDLAGAYALRHYNICGEQVTIHNARVPFFVNPVNFYSMMPKCLTCLCPTAPGWATLAHGIPVTFVYCSHKPVSYCSDEKFNAPSVNIHGMSEHFDTILKPLFVRENWQNRAFPTFSITDTYDSEVTVEIITKLCDVVGYENIRVDSYEFPGTAVDFLRHRGAPIPERFQ